MSAAGLGIAAADWLAARRNVSNAFSVCSTALSPISRTASGTFIVVFGSIVDFSLVLLGDVASVPAAFFGELSDNSDCQISNREVSPCHSKCKSLRPYFFILHL